MTTSASAAAVPGTEPSEITVLVQRAQTGDHEAFGDLAERLWPQLVTLARALLAVDGDAEDLVQDSLVHAWGRLWTLRSPESFVAWIRRIVTRRCLTRVRRQKPREEVGDIAIPSPAVGDRLDVARLLKTLGPRQRAALYLTWIEGCTDKEAGHLMGLRPSTVRVHRFRGLQRLRQTMERWR